MPVGDDAGWTEKVSSYGWGDDIPEGAVLKESQEEVGEFPAKLASGSRCI